MGDWIAIPPFADEDIVKAETFQDMWENLSTLKQKEAEELLLPGTMLAAWTTSSLTFTTISADYYRATFESHGGDLLIIVGLSVSNATDRATYINLTLDGVSLGNTLGMFYRNNLFSNGPEATQLVHIASPVDAGPHELIGLFRTSDALSASQLYDAPRMGLWIVELP